MKPLASLTSGELTAAAKAALQQICRQPLRRVKSGWHGNGRRFTLQVCEQLEVRGLARTQNTNGRKELAITGSGRMFAGILEERKRARLS